jgi:predicted transcriptional regulator
MRAVWCEGAQTVNQVQQCLHPRKPLAYTTVLTILDRLVHKGALTRVKQGKAYCYEPVVSFQESRGKAVMELVDFYFDGSREKLQEFLTSSTSQFEAEPSSDQTKTDSPEMNVCLL